MSLTLVTGVPGSGKTLHAVSVLLQDLLKSTFEYQGEAKPRKIFTNIKNLLLDHTLINADELNNWQDWASPGDVICFDEVQEVWRPRSMGAKVPVCIEKLETHRHMGVDFILITQHPMLLDQNIRRLVGRHLHVRRVSNFPLAVIYEWDHASNPAMVKSAMSTRTWRFSKAAYKLYHSAEAHTKQPRRLPFAVFILGAALVGLAFGSPAIYKRMDERINGKALTSTTVVTKGDTAGIAGIKPAESIPVEPKQPASPTGPIQDLKTVQAPFKPVGCMAMGEKCTCFGVHAEIIQVEKAECVKATTEIALLVDGSTPVPSSRPSHNSAALQLQKEKPATPDNGFNLPVPTVQQQHDIKYSMGPSGTLYAR